MMTFTTVMLYKRILLFWYNAGISPLNFTLTSDAEANTNFSFDSENSQNIDNSINNPSSIRKFQVYHVSSWKQAKPIFWLTFAFSICSFLFSTIKLLILIKQTDVSSKISVIIGAICWCSYILSCCFIYIVHLLKAKSICNFLHEWQIIEGEILTGIQCSF
jgi:hypothetical protein